MVSYEQLIKPLKLELAKEISIQLVDGCIGSDDSGGGLLTWSTSRSVAQNLPC
jgi:hypothetical protein